jgi:hypothetical protein
MRHFGYINQKTPVLLLGFNKAQNNILYVELSALNNDEVQWLSSFISKNYARETLVVPLNMETMRNGASAFQHFFRYAGTTEQYNIHMIDKGQCIEWFKHPSSYVNREIDHDIISQLKQKLETGDVKPGLAPGEVHPLLETLQSLQGDPRLAKMFSASENSVSVASETPAASLTMNEYTGNASTPSVMERLDGMEEHLKMIAKELKRIAVAADKSKKDKVKA